MRLNEQQYEKAKAVKEGDYIEPLRYWNQSSGPGQRLPILCKVLKVQHDGYGSSGIVFTVKVLNSDRLLDLDANWFKF